MELTNKFLLLITIVCTVLTIHSFSFGMYRRDKKIDICRQQQQVKRKPNYNLSLFSKLSMYSQCATYHKLMYVCRQRNSVLHDEFLRYLKHRNGSVTVSNLQEAIEIAMVNQDYKTLEFIKGIPRVSWIFCFRQDQEGVQFLHNIENWKIGSPITSLEDCF